MSALRTLVGRYGPFCFVLGLLTLAYWQLNPTGDSRWFVPALLALGLWLLFRGRKDRTSGEPPKETRKHTLPLALLALSSAAALAYWSTR